MKLTLRALVMVLIFAGSIFCRTWVYTHNHIDTLPNHHITSIKGTEDNSKTNTITDATWNRLFKSKRRIEKYGFVQQALVSPIAVVFYSTVTLFNLKDIQKPDPIDASTFRQPPRLSSVI